MIERLTAVPQLKRIKFININQSVDKLFQRALDITSVNKKEIGVYLCGNENNGIMEINKGAIRTSLNLDYNSFWLNPQSLDSMERSLCHQGSKVVALAHTHPDGNNRPSYQDRSSSLDLNMLGCVIGYKGVRCFHGDKDFEIFKSL